jgi:hypothetical protein
MKKVICPWRSHEGRKQEGGTEQKQRWSTWVRRLEEGEQRLDWRTPGETQEKFLGRGTSERVV